MTSLPQVHLFAPPWALDLLAHVWQSSLVALAVLALLTLCRSLPARTRLALGWIAAAKFAVPTAWCVRLVTGRAGTLTAMGETASGFTTTSGLTAAVPIEGWTAPPWAWPVFAGLWLT